MGTLLLTCPHPAAVDFMDRVLIPGETLLGLHLVHEHHAVEPAPYLAGGDL